MDSNTKELVDELVGTSYSLGELNAKVNALHDFVDEADRSVYRSDSAEIDTRFIRNLFGWKRCEPVGESHARLDE